MGTSYGNPRELWCKLQPEGLLQNKISKITETARTLNKSLFRKLLEKHLEWSILFEAYGKGLIKHLGEGIWGRHLWKGIWEKPCTLAFSPSGICVKRMLPGKARCQNPCRSQVYMFTFVFFRLAMCRSFMANYLDDNNGSVRNIWEHLESRGFGRLCPYNSRITWRGCCKYTF